MYYRLVYQLLSLDKLLDTDCVNLTTCLSALGDHLKANCKQQGRPGGVQWYTSIPKKNSPKYPKIPKIHPNILKINRSMKGRYFIPEIQRKWYTEYPYLSCNIPYTRFKKPLYTVYPKTLADPEAVNNYVGIKIKVTVFCPWNTILQIKLLCHKTGVAKYQLLWVASKSFHLAWSLVIRGLTTFSVDKEHLSSSHTLPSTNNEKFFPS